MSDLRERLRALVIVYNQRLLGDPYENRTLVGVMADLAAILAEGESEREAALPLGHPFEECWNSKCPPNSGCHFNDCGQPRSAH